MTKIRTVLGDVDPEKIGITLIHEHPYNFDFTIQIEELADFKKQGGSCVVDQTPIDIGRNPALLKRLAEGTGLHFIASTGLFYREDHHPKIMYQSDVDEIMQFIVRREERRLRIMRQSDVDEIVQFIVREIEESVEGGDFRAGLIGEIGTTEFGITAQEEKSLRASARAHLATGVNISVHTMSGAEALRAIDILQEEGVKPQRVIIDHVDHDHAEHLRMVAERGVFLGFDCIGKARYQDDAIRLELLCAMVEAGYEDQIVLSHDIGRPDYFRVNGGHGYVHLLGTFVPRLRERLSEETIEKFLIYNPRRALAF